MSLPHDIHLIVIVNKFNNSALSVCCSVAIAEERIAVSIIVFNEALNSVRGVTSLFVDLFTTRHYGDGGIHIPYKTRIKSNNTIHPLLKIIHILY